MLNISKLRLPRISLKTGVKNISTKLHSCVRVNKFSRINNYSFSSKISYDINNSFIWNSEYNKNFNLYSDNEKVNEHDDISKIDIIENVIESQPPLQAKENEKDKNKKATKTGVKVAKDNELVQGAVVENKNENAKKKKKKVEVTKDEDICSEAEVVVEESYKLPELQKKSKPTQEKGKSKSLEKTPSPSNKTSKLVKVPTEKPFSKEKTVKEKILKDKVEKLPTEEPKPIVNKPRSVAKSVEKPKAETNVKVSKASNTISTKTNQVENAKLKTNTKSSIKTVVKNPVEASNKETKAKPKEEIKKEIAKTHLDKKKPLSASKSKKTKN